MTCKLGIKVSLLSSIILKRLLKLLGLQMQHSDLQIYIFVRE